MTTTTVTCPECRTSLKITGPFARVRTARVKCPKCGSHFQVSQDGIQAAVPPPPTPPPVPVPEEPLAEEPVGAGASSDPDLNLRSGSHWLALALVSTVLVLGGGLAVAVFFATQPPRQPEVARNEQPKQPVQNVDDAAARREREKTMRAFERLMGRATAAMDEKRYRDAVNAYTAALDLVPEDAEAKKGLDEAQAALAPSKDDQQRAAEFSRFVKEGKDALAAKHYAAAVRALERAVLLKPSDVGAVKALDEAREAVAKDENEQKLLAEYKDHMKAGRAALVAQKYTDAVREFTAAQRLMPDDEDAGQSLQTAEKQLAAAGDQDKAKDKFTQLMKQAGAAMANRRYKEAVNRYQAALKLQPNDRDARDGLAEAGKAYRRARGEYNRLLAAAGEAQREMRFGDAVQAFQGALQIFPGDDVATAGLAQARLGVNNLVVGQAAYDVLMLQGQRSLQAGRYQDAAMAYWQALTLSPWDYMAAQGLYNAQVALNNAATQQAQSNATAQNRYNQLMKAASSSYKARDYSSAIRTLRRVLRDFPNDPQALSAMQQAQYQLYMGRGQAAYSAGRYADAVQAFQGALSAVPGDAAAMRGLVNARVRLRQGVPVGTPNLGVPNQLMPGNNNFNNGRGNGRGLGNDPNNPNGR